LGLQRFPLPLGAPPQVRAGLPPQRRLPPLEDFTLGPLTLESRLKSPLKGERRPRRSGERARREPTANHEARPAGKIRLQALIDDAACPQGKVADS
ncbi:MAG: hypothetical protein ACK562_08985, partial [Acidobacteriota bacterium]